MVVNRLKVLCNAAIPLLREHGWVFDPRIPPRRHVSYDGLATPTVAIIIGPVLVVPVVVVVLLLVVHGGRVVTRVV